MTVGIQQAIQRWTWEERLKLEALSNAENVCSAQYHPVTALAPVHCALKKRSHRLLGMCPVHAEVVCACIS